MGRRATCFDAGSDPGRRLIGRLLTEPARPAVIRRHPHAASFALASVCVGAFMGQLDASIVNLAYPALRNDFHASIAAVQWVGLSYLLVLVAMVTAVGRLADMVGHKLLYVYGFVVFTAGSALCAAAPSLVVLDAFRAIQAVGAAMMQANSVAIIANTVPRERLARAIGLQGTAQALGLGIGPAVGGLLVAAGGWQLVFLVNVPAGILGAAVGWFLIPRSRHLGKRVAFDWIGLAWFAPGATALLVALSLGAQGRIPLAVPLALGLATAACGTGFLLAERSSRHPMVDLALFRRRSFTVGITTGLLSYLVLFGALFVLPFFLEHAFGQGPGRAGLDLTVLPLALGVAAPVAGTVADRNGPRLPTVAGLVTAGGALAALAAAHGSLAVVLVELAVLGAGLGAFVPANNASVMGAAPRAQAGLASGILNTTRGLGTALGVAVGGLVFSIVGAGTGSVAHGTVATALVLAALSWTGAGIAALRSSSDRPDLMASAADRYAHRQRRSSDASMRWQI